MTMRRGHFQRKNRVVARIPTVSMGDIAFLLLIFFMATTVFKFEEGLEVRLPRAETSLAQKKDRVLHVWIDRHGRVCINDRFVGMEEVEEIVRRAIVAKPDLVVAFNADERAPYSAIADVMEELKDANAVRVSFTSEPQPREERRRR
jgi:biopolymer transport protein ExbD